MVTTRRARAYQARVRARRARSRSPGWQQTGGTPGEGAPAADGPVDQAPAEVARAEVARAGTVPGRTPARAAGMPAAGSGGWAAGTQLVAGEWFTVRPVSGSAAVKTYTCPECLQPIPPGFPHVVAWSQLPGLDGGAGLARRRHWHRYCWTSFVRRSG